MSSILIIDDEDKLRSLLSRIISLEGFETQDVSNLKAAEKKLSHQFFDVVICDVKLPDGNGVQFSRDLKDKYPLTEIIMLTAYGNIADGVQAIKNGAFDYITKGDDNNKIIPLLYRATEKVELARRVAQLEKQVGEKYSFESIIGRSKEITAAIDLAKRVAITDASILLLGETGTGKEVFAQAIHQASVRNKHYFVALNCSAFNRELLESELFGYKSGAFTGAIKDKKGLIEQANNGTLFLDEIGEMLPELQAKLLRVIETGEFLRVGDTLPTKVNIRIIAATNRDLSKEVEEGGFREDLFYRLSVFQITLPSLNSRKSDIHLLAAHFAHLFALKTNKRIATLSPEFLKCLEQYNWKGNIRELKNVMERAVIMTDSDVLESNCLPYDVLTLGQQASKSISAFSIAGSERLHIQKVLNYTQGNKAEAARLLEIGLATLYRKIEEYKIQ